MRRCGASDGIGMLAIKARVPRLAVSPISLVCPLCEAERGEECKTSAGKFIAIHVERIEMAALYDKIGKLRYQSAKRRRKAR